MEFWPETLGGWTSALQGIVVAAGGLWAVHTYSTAQRHKAAEVLLEVERAFREVQQTCDWLTSPNTYKAFYLEPLRKLLRDEPLDEIERERQTEVDGALRFFYFCSVLNTQLSVDLATLEKAYSFYLHEFVNQAERPELRAYVEEWYPRLFAWISKQDPHPSTATASPADGAPPGQ
ncbi:MAG: hypothetical protein P1V81_05795 [Planctomycetota bacterium]|nr:hypothetical protein [Planctomycetota bacterium]